MIYQLYKQAERKSRYTCIVLQSYTSKSTYHNSFRAVRIHGVVMRRRYYIKVKREQTELPITGLNPIENHLCR